MRAEASFAAVSHHAALADAELALTVEAMAFHLHPAPHDPVTLELVITADDHGPDGPAGETIVFFTARRPDPRAA